MRKVDGWQALTHIGILLFAGLYGWRWYLLQLGMQEPAVTFLNDTAIVVWSVIGILLVSSHLVLTYVHRRFIRGTQLFKWAIVGVISVSFTAMFVVYILLLYPMISPGLGGGSPEKISIWIKSDDFSQDARIRLLPSQCTEIGKLVRCDDVYSIAVGGEYFVLAGKQPPAVVLPNKSVTAFVNSEE